MDSRLSYTRLTDRPNMIVRASPAYASGIISSDNIDIVSIPLFNPNLVYFLEKQFHKTTEQAGILRDELDLYARFLSPVINRITSIQIQNGSFEGFLELFSETEKSFQNNYSKTLHPEIMKKFIDSLHQLKQDACNNIRFSQPAWTALRTAEHAEVKNRIAAAERKKIYDVCCILACVAWCPVEYIITLCNECGWDRRTEQSCRQECHLIPKEPGRYSLFAPCSSIENFVDDYEIQNTLIEEAQGPPAQKML
jgi:hypothetical protein